MQTIEGLGKYAILVGVNDLLGRFDSIKARLESVFDGKEETKKELREFIDLLSSLSKEVLIQAAKDSGQPLGDYLKTLEAKLDEISSVYARLSEKCLEDGRFAGWLEGGGLVGLGISALWAVFSRSNPLLMAASFAISGASLFAGKKMEKTIEEIGELLNQLPKLLAETRILISVLKRRMDKEGTNKLDS